MTNQEDGKTTTWKVWSWANNEKPEYAMCVEGSPEKAVREWAFAAQRAPHHITPYLHDITKKGGYCSVHVQAENQPDAKPMTFRVHGSLITACGFDVPEKFQVMKADQHLNNRLAVSALFMGTGVNIKKPLLRNRVPFGAITDNAVFSWGCCDMWYMKTTYALNKDGVVHNITAYIALEQQGPMHDSGAYTLTLTVLSEDVMEDLLKEAGQLDGLFELARECSFVVR
jgi:hypothetical protein